MQSKIDYYFWIQTQSKSKNILGKQFYNTAYLSVQGVKEMEFEEVLQKVSYVSLMWWCVHGCL